jgi:tRNA A-37 threonylcarbamoyl transferase component Bud32
MSVTDTPVLPATDTYTKLSGTTLRIVQSAVALLALYTVGLFIRAVPVALQGELAVIAPRFGQILTEIGLRPAVYVTYQVVLEAVTYGVFVVTGLAVIRRRPDDLVSLLSALMLVTWGGTTTNVFFYTNNLALPLALSADVINAVANVLFVWFIYTAPNGKFNPPWTKFVVGAWAVYIVGLGASVFLTEQAFFASFVGQVLVYGVSFFVINYRFANVFNPTEVQQFKWVALGLSFAFVGFLIRFLPSTLLENGVFTLPPAALLALDAGSSVALRVFLAMLPIMIAFSIMRYRLWDVDIMLNRSLVYGGVSVMVALLLIGDFFGFLWLLRLLTGGEQPTLAVALGTAVAVAAFTPLRNGLQRFVDRKLFGIEIDYRHANTLPLQGPTAQSALDDTDTFGPYQVMGLVGRGGMASVYRGYHPTLNRTVAIKVLSDQLAEQSDFRTRFEREAQTIANLTHPNVIQVFDFGSEGEAYYMVMEFVDGPTLSQVIKARGALPYEEVARIIDDVAAALDYAHLQGIVHRDVKPSNVMLRTITSTGEDDTQRAILTDFGIAKIATQDSITRTGMMGTLDYIAPEQIKAAADVDGRADIYALGVMTYQLLTGELPFRADNPGATVMGHLTKPAPNASEVNAAVPPHAALAVMRALAKTPDERFTTASAFAEHLGTAPEAVSVR